MFPAPLTSACLYPFPHVYWTDIGHQLMRGQQMARTLKDSSLDTRAARARLKARGKPYYRTIEEGLHLGYRKPRGRKGKPATSGKWVWRRYIGNQTYVVEVIGIADDLTDADGVAILNFSQAQHKARELFRLNTHAEAGTGPYTVAVAIK